MLWLTNLLFFVFFTSVLTWNLSPFLQFSFGVPWIYFWLISHRPILLNKWPSVFPLALFDGWPSATGSLILIIKFFVAIMNYLFVSTNSCNLYISVYAIDFNFFLNHLFGQLLILFNIVFLFLELLPQQLNSISHDSYFIIYLLEVILLVNYRKFRVVSFYFLSLCHVNKNIIILPYLR